MKEIKDLDVSKASQGYHIFRKVIQENADIFCNFIYQSLMFAFFQHYLKISKYQVCLQKFTKKFKRKL